MTLAERLAYPLQARPEMCSLNMGSMNFSIHPAARKFHEWKHAWERPYIEGMEDLIFRNTFRDIKHILRVLGDECGQVLREFFAERREQYRQRRGERLQDAPDTIPAGEAIELDLPPPGSTP